MQALSDDVAKTIQNDVNTQIADNAILAARGQSTLTSEEEDTLIKLLKKVYLKKKELYP